MSPEFVVRSTSPDHPLSSCGVKKMLSLRRSHSGRLRLAFLQDQAGRRQNDFAIGNDGHGVHSVAAGSVLSAKSAERFSFQLERN